MTDSVADHQLGGNSNPDDMNPCLVETGSRVMEELMDGLDADEKPRQANRLVKRAPSPGSVVPTRQLSSNY